MKYGTPDQVQLSDIKKDSTKKEKSISKTRKDDSKMKDKVVPARRTIELEDKHRTS